MEQIFVDGLKNLHFTGDMVRLNFMHLVPESNSQQTNLQVIMNVQAAISLRDSLNVLLDKMNVPQAQPLEQRYNPGIFSVNTIDEAKRIILTKESQDGSEERWRKETPALISMMKDNWSLHSGKVVLDYGCGIGRISKELCQLGCHVVGVDISPEMRKLAVNYVNDKRFLVVSPDQFKNMISRGFQADYACAIWVLQHCLYPEDDLNRIKMAMKPGGEMFLVNNKFSRAVPVRDRVWQNDNINIWKLCADYLMPMRLLPFPEGVGVDPKYFQCCFYKKV